MELGDPGHPDDFVDDEVEDLDPMPRQKTSNMADDIVVIDGRRYRRRPRWRTEEERQKAITNMQAGGAFPAGLFDPLESTMVYERIDDDEKETEK